MDEVTRAREMIDEVLAALGQDPAVLQVDTDLWLLEQGSARGYIALSVDERVPDQSRIFVRMRIMRVPAGGAAEFFRRLLALNGQMHGLAAFSVDDGDTVSLTSGRVLRGLDATEVRDLIARTALMADNCDDMLIEEFGPELAME